MISRRGLIGGLGALLLAAPAVVRAASLMPVRGIVVPVAPRLVMAFGGDSIFWSADNLHTTEEARQRLLSIFGDSIEGIWPEADLAYVCGRDDDDYKRVGIL